MSDKDESLVLKPREFYDVAKLQLESEFERFLEHPLTQAMEAFTGALALGARQLGISAGRMAQAILKGQMYEQLAEEWRGLREAGKIPDNLGETKHGLYTWAELMKIIDDECPDGERLDALKAAFYAVNRINESDTDKIVEYQLWQISKELRSGDILLLRSMYTRLNMAPGNHARDWAMQMAQLSGLAIPELLERYEKRFIDLLLMTPRSKVGGDIQLGYDASGIDTRNNRLTQLGVRFCRNIEIYKIDLEGALKAQQIMKCS
ncbi:MAG: hypothetical protein ABSC48_07795 [Terracidiphilus sp.]|jgi:hypothetical protein